MKLTDLALLSLQTAYMQKDLTTQGFCKGVQSEMRDMAAKTYNILIYQTLDKLQDTEFGNSLVNELAWQFHVDFFDPTADFDVKRNLVKKSIKMHRTKGTPQAVIDLLDTAFPSGTTTVLTEWWEYGGEPYHFRITTSSLASVSTTAFEKALNSVKNVRSRLDGVYLFKELLFGAISRIKLKQTIEYKVDVGNFVSYGFQDGKVFAFNTNRGGLKKYSFLESSGASNE